MKYVKIRMPEPGPFGETLREARTRAIVAAFFVNKPGGGCVESVVTPATQRRPFEAVFVDLLFEVDLGTSQSILCFAKTIRSVDGSSSRKQSG
jgi:hypothetical protein